MAWVKSQVRGEIILDWTPAAGAITTMMAWRDEREFSSIINHNLPGPELSIHTSFVNGTGALYSPEYEIS
jgi:hypothetical protein